MINRITELMKQYLDIASPSGYTEHAIGVCQKAFEDMGIKTSYTKKGGLLAIMEGQDKSKEVVVSAHMDTLGGMVKEILPNGRVRFQRIGGGVYNALEGENCTIIASNGNKIKGSVMPLKSSSHLYGQEGASGERNEYTMAIRLDEKVNNKEDVAKLGICVGDFLYMETRFVETESGFIKTRYIDNKAAVAIVLAVCESMVSKNEKPAYTTMFYISNFEEMGHGVSHIFSDKVEEFVALDIGIVGEGQQSSEYAVSIAAKDAKTVYDYKLRQKLVTLADNNGVDYKVDVYNRYSSDATQAVTTGCDFKFACIGPGVDASHHYERTHKDALINTAKLVEVYLKQNNI
ncbi:MAG: M42 family metallopeptidase [Cellulosilyticaceae bacterium]